MIFFALVQVYVYRRYLQPNKGQDQTEPINPYTYVQSSYNAWKRSWSSRGILVELN